MSIEDITDPTAVAQAISEFDRVGRDAFLKTYGFGEATRWYVEQNGSHYNSKAILGVAHKYQFGQALGPHQFYGGRPTNRKLEDLGFTVINLDKSEGELPPVTDATHFWILAARPDRYRLLDAVRELDEDWWRSGRSHLRKGDRVAIWTYKGHDSERGIVALGLVLTDTAETDLPDEQHPYWISGAEPLAARAPRVLVRYVVRPDPPLWMEDAPEDSVLRRLKTVEAQGGTAFTLSEGDWDALVTLAGGWPAPAASTAAAESEIEAFIKGKSGQGFGLNAARRRAVELRAMDVVGAHYRNAGWKLKDVSAGSPFDWHCQQGGQTLNVEVKGTTGGPESVLLTKNEVASARKDPKHAVLAVVHGIDLDFAADPPTASGGKLLWLNPWHIRDKALTPIAYRYVLPSDEISKATGTL